MLRVRARHSSSALRNHAPHAGRLGIRLALLTTSVIGAVVAAQSVRQTTVAAPASATVTLAPSVDTYVDASAPTTSMAAATTLQASASPVRRGVVRFGPVTGVTSVTSATLRLRNTSGATGGVQVHATTATWTAATTWQTAPGVGTLLGYSHAYSGGAWVTVDVTTAVSAGNAANFAITTDGAATAFSSSRGGSAPQLVVTGIAVPRPTPTPTPTVAPTPTAAPPGGAGLSVSGATLMLDGKAFLARGFNMIGVLSPPGCNDGHGAAARTNFGQAEMTQAAKTWYANTLRFQVSQQGLATTSSSARTAYLNQIRSAVALAHTNGFVVILSMQDQGIGCGTAHPLPSSATVTAWSVLAPVFASDHRVMYEMFNEPQNDPTTAGWAQWLSGGSTPLSNQGVTAVGHQTLVRDIRADGATNVLLADGARHAEHLDGIPMLHDTTAGKGIVYAVHPYYFSPGQAYWDSTFGYLSSSVPVIATEWNYLAADCGTAKQTLAPSFLTYLQNHHIGITGHAFDYQDTLVSDWKWTPTQCGGAVGGAGAVLKAYYARLAGH